jgi:hypothetical protein
MVMSDISYSARLRDLSKEYYQNHIRLDEYRAQRKIVIDKIDIEFNGAKIGEAADESSAENHDQSSVFMKTIAFFKNNDVDE